MVEEELMARSLLPAFLLDFSVPPWLNFSYQDDAKRFNLGGLWGRGGREK